MLAISYGVSPVYRGMDMYNESLPLDRMNFSTSSLSSIIAPFSNKISIILTLPTEAAYQRAVLLFSYNIKIRPKNLMLIH